jgi:hypothetical protein
MKIEIEILDDYKDASIYVIAQGELAAYKRENGLWKIKVSRCNKCGKCCMGLGDVTTEMKFSGNCYYLKKFGEFYECMLGPDKPLGCHIGSGENIPECTEAYK